MTPGPERGVLLRSFAAALVIVLLTAGASATAALLTLDDLIPDDPTPGGDIADRPFAPPRSGKPQTLLLMGSDRRYADRRDDPVRSDTLMLVRLDPRRATTVLSIPRDLRVPVPGHGVQKINDAYGLGGEALTVETVKALTGLQINHAINVNFKGFRKVVDLFDCIYADVDRRYLHSNAGVPVGQRYDAIDVKAGYQPLCGTDALDYVRYRHGDSDIVRAARQQDFLRAAKDQVSTSAMIDDPKTLSRTFFAAARTDGDLRTTQGFLRLAKVALSSADRPVRQIPFPAEFVKERDGDREIDFVQASPVALQAAVARFAGGAGAADRRARATPKRPSRAARAARRREGSPVAAGLVEARAGARAAAAELGRRRVRSLGFGLRLPTHLTQQGRYASRGSRIYSLRDRGGTLHRAYRVVLSENTIDGQYVGVQGTSWRTPPLLAEPSERRRVRGRTLELFRAGGRLRFVAWRTDRAAYWISNTLGMKLDNDEMLALAASLDAP